jgi:citrate lyase beta subunit
LESWRSWHFVPSHRRRHLEKARSLPADVLVFDLEDGVPLGLKEEARSNLRDYLRDPSSSDAPRRYVRVNSDEAEFRKDREVLQSVHVDGLVLPKVTDGSAVKSRMAGVPKSAAHGGLALIESFTALTRLGPVLDAWPLAGVGLGLEDLFADVDVRREEARDLDRHVRLRVVVETKARGLLSIDSVSLEYCNRRRFRLVCSESRALGFDGMFSLHPDQLAAINSAFGPKPAEVRWATRIGRLTAMNDGGGYSKKGADLISPPKVRKARRILARAEGVRIDHD